jgi:mannose-6-phosphate isomerase-like protein (cupin superfamily)
MGQIWDAKDLGSANGYAEFLRRDPMSAGMYRLRAGATDPQEPHREDEIYVVLKGAARFRHGDTIDDVRLGSIIFVPAHEPHRFEDITEDLDVLVFFAPAESSTDEE